MLLVCYYPPSVTAPRLKSARQGRRPARYDADEPQEQAETIPSDDDEEDEPSVFANTRGPKAKKKKASPDLQATPTRSTFAVTAQQLENSNLWRRIEMEMTLNPGDATVSLVRLNRAMCATRPLSCSW